MAASLLILHEEHDGQEEGIFLDGSGAHNSLTIVVEDCKIWCMLLEHISAICVTSKGGARFEAT
jgi:hypothetical protein